MLGKLLKFEFKHSARYVMLIYGCAGIFALFMLFGYLAKITFISIISSMVLYFVGIIAVVMTLVAVIKNFYDTLYGKQGYLSFTLPVKASSLLLSKVIIAFFWIIMSMILGAVIFLLIFLNAKGMVDGSLDGFFEVFKQSGLIDLLPSKAMVAELAFYAALLVLLNILVFVGFVFFSVTLANTRALQGHPKLFGFLIFFVSYCVSNSISVRLTYSFPLALHITNDKIFFAFKAMTDGTESLAAFGVGGTLFMAVAAVGLLVATGKIMEHKVNIK